MNKRNNKWWVLLLVLCILLAIFFMGLFGYLVVSRIIHTQDKQAGQQEQWEEQTQEQENTLQDDDTDLPPSNEEEQPDSETEEPVHYDPPNYEFDTSKDTIEVKIEGLSRSYRIAWVSDLHLITDLEPAEDVFEEYVETLKARHDTSFVTPDGTTADELWPEIIKFLNYEDFDAVIFGGDIMDYCSRSNLDTFLEGYRELKYDKDQILYVRADHDYGAYYGGDVLTEWRAHELHAMEIDGYESYDPLDDYNKILDLGELAIVGINGSTKNMSGDQLEVIANQLQEDKPVIIATHVPYEPQTEEDKQSLAELSMAVRNQIYYWSEESTHYIPVERTLDYFNYLYSDDTPVRQVCAGHLHSGWDGMLTDTLGQHIFTPAYLGAIGIIEVTP